MNLKKCIQIFALATLGLPVAALSQVSANPFGTAPKTSVIAVDMTKAEALAALTSSDKSKVHPDHLTKLLDKAPNTQETFDCIVPISYICCSFFG